MAETILSSFQQAKKSAEVTLLDNLKSYLKDIIQFDTTKSKKQSEVQNFAKKYGNFLLKLVSQNLKDLETETTIELINLKTSATELALNQLDKIQSELTGNKLDLEKYWCKLVSKVLGTKQYASALRYADIFLARLKVFQQKEWQVKESTSFLPSRRESSDYCGCLLSGLVNKGTCLVETTAAETSQPYETFITGTCLRWLEYYDSLNAQKCAPYYDAFCKLTYRFLFMTHPNDAKECSALRLSLQLGALKGTSSASFFEHMLKSATNFEAGNRNNACAGHCIMTFYLQGFGMAKTPDKFYPQYVNCLYHFATFTKGQPDKEGFLLKGLNFLESVNIAASQRQLIDVHMAAVLLHLATSEITLAASRKDKKVSSECLARLEKASALISTGISGLKIDSAENSGEPQNYGALAKLAKYLMDLKKIFQQHCSSFHQPNGDTLEVPPKGLPTFEKLMVACFDVIDMGIRWEQQFETQGVVLKANRFKGLLSTQLDAIVLAAQITYTANSNLEAAMAYFKRAEDAAYQSDTHELRWVATGYYNLGVKLYGMEMYAEAIQPLEASCTTWVDWLRATGDSVTAKLSKRFEVLSACRRQTNDLEGALEAAVHAISVADFSTVPSKLIESFVWLQSKLRVLSSPVSTPTLFEILQGMNPPVSPREKGLLLEEQYKYCHTMSSLHTPQDLVEVVDQLLAVYTEKDLPVHRARVLVERGKLLRLFNPDTEKPDAEAAVTVIQEAIGLLEHGVVEKLLNSVKSVVGNNPAKAFQICCDKASKVLEAKTRDYSKIKSWLQIILGTSFQSSKLHDFGHYLDFLTSTHSEDTELASICESASQEQVDLLQLLDDLATAYCWLGLIQSEVDDTKAGAYFRTAVALWSELIQQLEPNQEPLVHVQRFKSVEATMHSLKIVIGFLKLVEESTLQLAMLDIFVSLSWLANPDRTEAASDIVYGYCAMAQAYLSLGFEAHAALYLQKAQEKSPQAGENTSTLLQMTSFLVRLHTEEDATEVEEAAENLLAKEKKTREELDLLGQLFHLKSLCYHRQHNTEEALDHAIDALSFRRGCLPQFYAQVLSSQADSVTFTDLNSEWNSLANFLESLHHTAVMWENLGDPIRSQMYQKTILDLSEESHNHNLKTRCLLVTAALDFKCHKWEEFEQHFDQLNNLVQTHCNHQHSLACKYHAAEHAILQGDFLRHKHKLDESLQCYNAGKKLVDAVFVALKSAVKDSAALLTSYDNIPENLQLLTSARKTKPRDLAINEAIDLLKSATTEDHKHLAILLSRIKTRQALVYMELEKWDHAEKSLKEALESIEEQTPTLEKAMVLYFLGLLPLYQSENLLDAAWVLGQKEQPVAKPVPASRTKKAPAKSKALEPSGLAECEKYLKEADAIATKLRIPQWIQQISKALALVTGRSNSVQTSACLGKLGSAHLIWKARAIGSASSSQMKYFIHKKQKSLQDKPKSKSRKGQDSVDQLSSMFSSLSIKDAVRHRLNALDTVFSMDMDNIQKEVIDVLPQTWSVCNISVVLENKYMIVSRWRAEKQPLVIRIPITDSEDSESKDMLTAIKQELDSILTDIKVGSVSKESLLPQKDWKAWWHKRELLDDRMGKLLKMMEQLFSCWKGILLGSYEDDSFESALQEKLANIASKLSTRGYQVDIDYLELCFLAFPHLTDKQNSLARQILCQALNWKDEDSITSKQSKELDEILLSLQNQYIDVADRCRVSPDLTLKTLQDLPRHPVILILDKDVQNLPWESIPLLRNHSVCRMVSVPFLLSAALSLKTDKMTDNDDIPSVARDGVDPRKVTYILNPSKDLDSTQDQFEENFKSRPGWSGMVGQEPTADEVKSLLQSSNLMIYCGHNAGEKYLSISELLKTDTLFDTVVLLMGCSSAQLKDCGEFDPAVGNLWDVTDRDLDRFTQSLLQGWLDNDNKKLKAQPLSSVICEARKSCKLKNLIGAAPVCYGIPVFPKHNTFTSKLAKSKATAVETESMPEAPRKGTTKEVPAKVKATKPATRAKRITK